MEFQLKLPSYIKYNTKNKRLSIIEWDSIAQKVSNCLSNDIIITFLKC